VRGKTRSACKGGLLKIPKRALIRNGNAFFRTGWRRSQRSRSGRRSGD